MIRKAGKAGMAILLASLLLVAAYAAVGFYLAPYLFLTQLLPEVSERVGVRLTAERVDIDPFRPALAVHGFSLKDRAGHELAAFRDLSVHIEGRESLRQRRLVLAGKISQLVMRPELDARSGLNFAALVPAGQSDRAGFPFLVTRFGVEQGRIEFRDVSRGKPYTMVFERVDANLENFGPEPDGKATFRLTAESADRESLAAEGRFSLAPFAAEGKLEFENVALAPLLDWLAPEFSGLLRSGKAGGKADYLLHTGNKIVLEVRSTETRAEGLELAMHGAGEPWLRIASASSGQFFYSLADQHFKVESVVIQEAVTTAPGEPEKDAGKPAPANPMARKDDGEGDDHSPEAASQEIRGTRIGTLRISNAEGSLEKRSVTIGAVVSENGIIDVRLAADGVFKVRGLPAVILAPDEQPPEESTEPWTARVDEVQLSGYAVGFQDETVEPPVRLRFAPGSLRLTGLTSEPGRQLEFRLNIGVGGTGKIEVDGQARLDPLQAELRFGIDQFQLRSLQPYWEHLTGVDLVKGRLNMWGDLTLERGSELRVDYSGAADIVDLATVDKKEGKDFMNWRSLKFDGVVINTQPKRVGVRSMTAEQPYARVFVSADGGLNLTRDLIQRDRNSNDPKPADPPPETPSNGRWPIVIGSLRVADGRMDFADFTLTPNFAVEIFDLNGNIRGLSSKENAKAELLLEGHLNHNSPVKIYGHFYPFQFSTHTDIAMEFRGVNLTTLSPYSGKFAGYRIEKGKLDMNLRYKLRDRTLEAENKVILDQLVLGERVESSTATTLPVDLAVALLRDSAGRIDIDLPIRGNLRDPQFSLRRLYANAFTQMIAKLVGSPFSLLGSLVPNGGEELGYVTFRPGDVSLDDTEKSKLGKVATALKERPGLNLDIKGFADPVQDRLALAETALSRQLKNARLIELRIQGQRVSEGEVVSLSDEEYRRLFTEYCRTRHPCVPELRNFPLDDRKPLEGVLFERVKRKVLEKWAISELDLRLLAQERSERIRDFMVRERGLPDQRIYLLDVKLAEPGDREIKTFLSLSGS